MSDVDSNGIKGTGATMSGVGEAATEAWRDLWDSLTTEERMGAIEVGEALRGEPLTAPHLGGWQELPAWVRVWRKLVGDAPASNGADLDGLPWHQAPVPPVDHHCQAQTVGFSRHMVGGSRLVQRCACGAIRFDLGPDDSQWSGRNERKARG